MKATLGDGSTKPTIKVKPPLEGGFVNHPYRGWSYRWRFRKTTR